MKDIQFYKLFDEDRFEELCQLALELYASRELRIYNQAFTSQKGTDDRKDVYIEFDKLESIIVGQVKFFEDSDQYNSKEIKTKIRNTIGGTFSWDGKSPTKKKDLIELDSYKNKKIKYLFFYFSCQINEVQKAKMENAVIAHYKKKHKKDIKVKIFGKNEIISLLKNNSYKDYAYYFDKKVQESSLGEVDSSMIKMETPYARKLEELGYEQNQIIMYLRYNVFFERYYDNHLLPNNLLEISHIKKKMQEEAMDNYTESIKAGKERHNEVLREKLSFYSDKFESHKLEDKISKGTYGNMSEIDGNKFDERIEW